jgi:acetyl-CoA/propionyl-CoA carboxylase
VLVANRGEIAVRIIRALKILEIEAVAVYSDADVSAMHVRMADRAFELPGLFPRETYLVGPRIIEIARRADCDAIHPGYGFLSEASEFSQLCSENSIKFIGPKASTLRISGNKLECKKKVEQNGVPVIPYAREPVVDQVEAAKVASDLGFPVLLKSAFGGGGRGIREAENKEEVREGFESAEREAKGSFGKFALYLEKKLLRPRHIEVQILASDDSTEIIHLGERECSIQRRYQKLIELSPSPVVDEEARKVVTSFARKAATTASYSNAGTVEFLRDSEGNFYFMEINSRLQVEHPVTEAVTGIDLVQSQIQIAAKNKLPFSQKEIKMRGCAIECRINAEDPFADFAPTSGTVRYLFLPAGPGIRVDTALETGTEVSPYYDSLLAKLIAKGSDFDQARRRAMQALREFTIYDIGTTLEFHQRVLESDQFARGEFDTGFVDSSGIMNAKPIAESSDDDFALAAILLAQNKTPKSVDERNQSARPTWTRNREGRFVDAL